MNFKKYFRTAMAIILWRSCMEPKRGSSSLQNIMIRCVPPEYLTRSHLSTAGSIFRYLYISCIFVLKILLLPIFFKIFLLHFQASRNMRTLISCFLFQNISRNSDAILKPVLDVPVHKITLNPGEILYVPRHYWHAVQNTSRVGT